MYDARAVANVMLRLSDAEGLKLTNLKLQKLLYLAHGYSLVRFGQPLIKGGFEAWNFGPVSRTAYAAFKKYDESIITAQATRLDPVKRVQEEISVDIEYSSVVLIGEVVRHYGRWSAFDLVEFTHQADTPWSITYHDQGRANVGMVIDDSVIGNHFEGPEEFGMNE